MKKEAKIATEILDSLRENIESTITALGESDAGADVVCGGFMSLGIGGAATQILMQRFWNARVKARGPEPIEPPQEVTEPRCNLQMPEVAPAGMFGRETWHYNKI